MVFRQTPLFHHPLFLFRSNIPLIHWNHYFPGGSEAISGYVLWSSRYRRYHIFQTSNPATPPSRPPQSHNMFLGTDDCFIRRHQLCPWKMRRRVLKEDVQTEKFSPNSRIKAARREKGSLSRRRCSKSTSCCDTSLRCVTLIQASFSWNGGMTALTRKDVSYKRSQ